MIFSKAFHLDLYRYADKPSSRAVFGSLLRHPGYAACVLLRIQQAMFARRRYVFAQVLRYVGITLFGFDCVPGSQIGPGLLLPHPGGLVIGKGVIIGEHATILQQVTLGESHVDGSGNHDYPRLGAHVVVGAGAKVLGGIVVESGVTVGANSVVLSDCPPNSVVVGSPARVVRVKGLASEPGR